MSKIRAAITGVGGYVPDYRLDNDELSQMVDTSDEWIMQRIGIKERRILKEKGKATSDLAVRAITELLEKTNTDPSAIDLLVCPTITSDMPFPATSNIITHKLGLKNAFNYDISAACSGFIYGLEIVSRMIESGAYKKAILVGADMMSSITNYADRTTCPLFGDGAGAVLIEPTEEEVGVMDRILGSDGAGAANLHIKAGGSLRPSSHETVDNLEHFVYQEGQVVFKAAVSKMSDLSVEIMERNNIGPNDLAYLVPHQANKRIIEAVGRRMGINPEQVLVNIERYGNTTSATIPLCFWDFEKKLKKGDNLILTAFGAGFTFGSVFLKWAYDPA
ncbi:MAG: ketoacyl-ACP synthase III [Bacteroidales bacterium]|nr:ketoacyl-ACP synthase III [Bacteroidales bacterium]MBN2821229.1 ketoacyl-ACP synthase III [Bacteroidales bacterium]